MMASALGPKVKLFQTKTKTLMMKENTMRAKKPRGSVAGPWLKAAGVFRARKTK